MTERIAVCTTTFYPKWHPGDTDVQQLIDSGDRATAESKIRGDLALELIEAVLRAGYHLVLVDGAKDSQFQQELTRRGIHFDQERQRGMSAARVQAFDAAYALEGVEAVVWTEPEKVRIVNYLETLTASVLAGNAAIVIPSRTEAGWESMPSYQRDSEQKANGVFNDKLHRAGLLPDDVMLDMYFGPRVYSALTEYREVMLRLLHQQYAFDRKETIPLHGTVDPSAYSQATFFPPVAALHERLPVQDVPVDFTYPASQRVLEEHQPFVEGQNGYGEKRKRQQVGILTELVHLLRTFQEKPSRLRSSSDQ